MHAPSAVDAEFAAVVGDALADHDVRLDQTGRSDDAIPCVCVANQLNDDLVEAVRTLTVAHMRHVLVVLRDDGHTWDGAWRLLSHGASDVLHWAPGPGPPEHRSGDTPTSIVRRLRRWQEIDDRLASEPIRGRLVGNAPAFRRTLHKVVEIACYAQGSVLVTGESGCGKELVARLLHQLDPRPDKKNFVVVDCTTIVPALSGSEIFGHERGAFTGAVSSREGAVGAANEGTLFLDEVGELPVELQAELLRVIQEGSYKRVGSDRWNTTTFRLICATHRDLIADQAAGRFRSDLYHRLATHLIHLPPLRERAPDILPLFRHFLTGLLGPSVDIDRSVSEMLRRREYPGNVRDLRQLATRIAARNVGTGVITPGDVPEDDRPSGQSADVNSRLEDAVRDALEAGLSFREIRDAAADTAIRLALADSSGSVRTAAQRLGITDRAVHLRRSATRRSHQD